MDYFWTDATVNKQNIREMETSHLINVAKTIWGWALRKLDKKQSEQELYEMLPGFGDIEEKEVDYFAYAADHYEIFEPIVGELRERHIRVYDEHGFLLFDDRRIHNG